MIFCSSKLVWETKLVHLKRQLTPLRVEPVDCSPYKRSKWHEDMKKLTQLQQTNLNQNLICDVFLQSEASSSIILGWTRDGVENGSRRRSGRLLRRLEGPNGRGASSWDTLHVRSLTGSSSLISLLDEHQDFCVMYVKCSKSWPEQSVLPGTELQRLLIRDGKYWHLFLGRKTAISLSAAIIKMLQSVFIWELPWVWSRPVFSHRHHRLVSHHLTLALLWRHVSDRCMLSPIPPPQRRRAGLTSVWRWSIHGGVETSR